VYFIKIEVYFRWSLSNECEGFIIEDLQIKMSEGLV